MDLITNSTVARLMLHITFRHMSDLLGENDTYAAAYHHMLQSANLPPSLEEDVRTFEQFEIQQLTQDDNTVADDTEVHVDDFSNICIYLYFYVAPAHKSAANQTSR